MKNEFKTSVAKLGIHDIPMYVEVPDTIEELDAWANEPGWSYRGAIANLRVTMQNGFIRKAMAAAWEGGVKDYDDPEQQQATLSRVAQDAINSYKPGVRRASSPALAAKVAAQEEVIAQLRAKLAAMGIDPDSIDEVES